MTKGEIRAAVLFLLGSLAFGFLLYRFLVWLAPQIDS
jgi:hypothetical protein